MAHQIFWRGFLFIYALIGVAREDRESQKGEIQ